MCWRQKIRVSGYTGHDCSGDYRVSVSCLPVSIFICVFSTDVRYNCVFPRWYRKTAVLNSNSCEDVSSQLCEELVSWSFQLIFFWMRSGFPHRTHTSLNSGPEHSSSVGLPLSFSGIQLCHQDTSFKQNLPLQNLMF